MNKAIETTYKGYRFRSRLEARWAVFFDALEIPWQYEPEGFEKADPDNEERVVRYLPDFYLPQSGTWVEVKGAWTEADASQTAEMLDWGSPLWHFDDSGQPLPYEKRKEAGIVIDCRGLLLLGNIPEVKHGRVFHPAVTHYKGLRLEYVEFKPGLGPTRVDFDLVHFAMSLKEKRPLVSADYLDSYGCSPGEARDFFAHGPVITELKWAPTKVCEAYAAAKSARFEFGESGALA